MTRAYDDLVKRLKEISDIRYAEALLGWDQQTYMPPKGNEARARQMSVLSALAHERLVDPRVGELMEKAAAEAKLTADEEALLREARHDRDKAVKVPTALVREISETAGRAHMAWVDARQKNDFPGFAPLLGRLVELKKQEAEAIGYEKGGVPYDALIDGFENGATVAKLDPVLSRTRDFTIVAARAIKEAQRKPNVDILRRTYPKAEQAAFCAQLIRDLGYDLEAGRLDEAVHPFTSGFAAEDVRITTRYHEDWLPAAVFGTVHETGHALYEQGLSSAMFGTPLGDAVSLGFHESQSRLWENQIGRSLSFWKRYYPRLKEHFPAALKDVSLTDFHFAINAVEPSLIRVEADEVTYNLHIIVRYEMEKAIFSGDLKVDELPQAWNERMVEYLGICPRTDAEGVLQDIHWSFGGFGYFPTYLLGNLYAAQWTAVMRRDLPDLDGQIERGEFGPVLAWLREKIHVHGRRYTADELTRRISGESLNPSHFAAYIRDKYGKLYGVKW